MGSVEWRMKGQWIKNCNCAYGSPDLSGLSWAAPHRIRAVMPEGFEHHEGEIASAKTLKSSGGIKYSYNNSHSTLAKVDHGPKGLVHPAS